MELQQEQQIRLNDMANLVKKKAIEVLEKDPNPTKTRAICKMLNTQMRVEAQLNESFRTEVMFDNIKLQYDRIEERENRIK